MQLTQERPFPSHSRRFLSCKWEILPPASQSSVICCQCQENGELIFLGVTVFTSVKLRWSRHQCPQKDIKFAVLSAPMGTQSLTCPLLPPVHLSILHTPSSHPPTHPSISWSLVCIPSGYMQGPQALLSITLNSPPTGIGVDFLRAPLF